jgi:YHS domain-containing protein
MQTSICPTCGCSLVRLGIGREEAVSYQHSGGEYRFCCEGCVEVFVTDPEKYVREVSNLAVCPVCLAEKPIESTIALEHDGTRLRLCRCPHCAEAFERNPEHYLERLAG